VAALTGVLVALLLSSLACYFALVHRMGEQYSAMHGPRKMVATLQTYYKSVGVQAKLKIIISFYGIVTTLPVSSPIGGTAFIVII